MHPLDSFQNSTHIPTKKCPEPEGYSDKFYQIFSELASLLIKLLPN